MKVVLRAGRPDDAETCGQICYQAFKSISDRHNFPPDFPDAGAAVGLMSFLLSRDDIYSVVAEVDGRVVGSNFLWEYPMIAGIGPITIDPDAQNSSVGKSLMQDVLQRVRDGRFAGVRLVQAAYHSRSLSLYTKLGFDTREPLSLIQGPPIGVEIPGHSVRPASEGDLEACNDLCRRIHGHDRGSELAGAIKEGTATLVERAGRVTGYATLVGFFGHAVAENNDDMKALISAAPAFAGTGFLLPTRNGELMRWCLANGLRVVQPMTLMSKGLYNEPVGAFLPSIVF
jgi:GNAT superfamily N-acetyltransferase